MRSDARGARRDDGTERRSAVFVVHLPFVATAALAALGLTVYDRALVVQGSFVAGVLVLAVSVAASLLVPWHRVRYRAEVVLPLLDLVSVACFVAGDVPLTLLAVFPVLWLAQRHGALGTGLGIAGAFAVTWIPTALTGDVSTPTQVVRVSLVPVVLSAVALSVGSIQRRSDARHLLLRRQGTQLRQAATELGSERRLLEAVVSTAGVGILVLDADGRVVLTNRLLAEATDGVVVPDALVQDLPDLRPTTLEGVKLETGPVERAVLGDDVPGEVGWWPLPTGRRALRTSAVQLEGADPRTGGRLAVVTFEDLTDQLTALELKEDFVAAASHELRTPLTSIVGHLELAADEPGAPPAVTNHLEVAARNADRLLALTDDLLTAAATRGGDLELDSRPVDLAATVDDAVTAIGPTAAEAGLRLTWARPRTTTHVQGDPVRLRQVVDNLLSNAVKYSDPGGDVDVAVTRDPDLPEGAHGVLLRVRDHGVGIGPDDVALVFTRFYRARSMRHGPRHGTGLGLHICRQVVEAHGGTIELASEPEVGTTVEVRLPATPSTPGGPRA